MTAGLDAISQVVRYYEWLLSYIENVARAYPIIKPKNGIRIIVIASDFDSNIIRLTKYIELDISLVKYIGLENEDTKEIGIVYEVIVIEPIQQTELFKSIDDIIDYILQDTVRTDFEKIISDLKKEGVKIKPYRGGKKNWIEVSYSNKAICYFRTRRKFVLCKTWNEEEEEWSKPIRIYNYKQWEEDFKNKTLSQII